tara:strand:- start:688 stop:1089 length:402 start_codon:yes stop_codon:yes gene_type:complete
MRGFQKRLTKQITFSDGAEKITYTVTAPSPLFGGMLRACYPPPEGDDPAAKSVYWDARALILAAEGLRATEEIPPHPEPKADRTAWDAYAHSIGALFEQAGLTTAMVIALRDAYQELDGATDLGEVLEEEGNG